MTAIHVRASATVFAEGPKSVNFAVMSCSISQFLLVIEQRAGIDVKLYYWINLHKKSEWRRMSYRSAEATS